MINALSFDIEDWFHLVDVPALADPADWPSFPSIVERHTDEILVLLAEHGVRATFFILGWIAVRYPALVRAIAAQGHELGSHSHLHGKVYAMTPAEFRADLRRSIDAIENACGRAVTGFRAPSFSITPGSEWAFDAMLAEGIHYDASLFPAARAHGGYACAVEPHLRKTSTGDSIPELPMSVMRVAGRRVPFSGGGYLRLLPAPLIRHGFDQLHRCGVPTVVYLHPRDFAPDCPVAPMPMHRRFKSYVGLRTTARKLHMLLETYRFDTCQSVLSSMRLNAA